MQDETRPGWVGLGLAGPVVVDRAAVVVPLGFVVVLTAGEGMLALSVDGVGNGDEVVG